MDSRGYEDPVEVMQGLCGLEVRTVTLLQLGLVQRCLWPWASKHFSTGRFSLAHTCCLE